MGKNFIFVVLPVFLIMMSNSLFTCLRRICAYHKQSTPWLLGIIICPPIFPVRHRLSVIQFDFRFIFNVSFLMAGKGLFLKI